MALIDRAKDCIAQISLTNSKHPSALIEGVYPTHVIRGLGGSLLGEDGTWYADFICGLGANLIGYGYGPVNHAVMEAISFGVSHSLPTYIEVEAAEKIKQHFHWCDLVKFVKTGTEACMAAIRIARNATGRTTVLSEGYHGWSDQFVSLVPPGNGLAPQSGIEQFTSLEQIDNTVAAVIIEPVQIDYSEERRLWLVELKERCNRLGVVLIFDEIITGFRWPKMAVANAWNIKPDLICLGKALGNGFSIGVVAGKRSLLNTRDYFVSGTFAGEVTGLVAAKAVIDELACKRVDIDLMWADATAARKTWEPWLREIGIGIDGYPTRGVFTGDIERKAQFWAECCRNGILFGPSFFWCYQQTGNRAKVDHGIKLACDSIKAGKVPIPLLPKSPFAARARGQA